MIPDSEVSPCSHINLCMHLPRRLRVMEHVNQKKKAKSQASCIKPV